MPLHLFSRWYYHSIQLEFSYEECLELYHSVCIVLVHSPTVLDLQTTCIGFVSLLSSFPLP